MVSTQEVSFMHNMKYGLSSQHCQQLRCAIKAKGRNELFGWGQYLVIAIEFRTIKEAEGSIPLLCDL